MTYIEARYPTMESIHEKIQSLEPELPKWSLSTTKSVLNTMGIRFVRSHAVNHAVLIEDSFIVEGRKRYITKIRKFRLEGRTIYFLDESYINTNHCPARVMTDTTIKSAKDAKERGLTTGNLANSFFSDTHIMKILGLDLSLDQTIDFVDALILIGATISIYDARLIILHDIISG